MASYRRDRINGQLTAEISDILRSVKDYRVTDSLVSVTGVDCTADLKSAKVYISSVGTLEAQEEVRRGLVSATGYIRSQLARRLNLRITPELTFITDTSMEHGMRISKLLHSVEQEMADFEVREAEYEAKKAAEAASAESAQSEDASGDGDHE